MITPSISGRLDASRSRILPLVIIARGAVVFALFYAASGSVNGQNFPNVPPPPAAVVQSPTQFKIGEKLTYTFSMDRFRNVAYAETHVVSRGLLNGREAVELRARYKTLDFVSASVISVDEERIVFADAVTGLPLFVRSIDNSTVLPTESISDLIAAPVQHLDLATLIFRIRHTGGAGVFNIYEKGRVFAVTVQSNGVESVKTEAGMFETMVFSVQSDYFASHGISDVRINLSSDADRVPVLARFRSGRGNLMEAKLASVQLLVPDPPAPVITPVPTPLPIPTPTPVRTPEPYIDNEPLSRDIAFVLGERLEYSIIAGARPAGSVVIQARERKKVNGVDSLLLTADVISHDAAEQALRTGDLIRAQVDPQDLSPHQTEMQFRGALSGFSQTASFDPVSRAISIGGGTRIEGPVGTHSMMSLLYAMRSFSLRPPVNPMTPPEDTRVAVLWVDRTYVFSLRPSEIKPIMIEGQNVPAQQISISTGDPQLDQLNIRVWLSADTARTPLRIAFGMYQADLISRRVVAPQ